MAKEILRYIQLPGPACAAIPSPPNGPAFGHRGLNIMEFCQSFNAKTKDLQHGAPIPEKITTPAKIESRLGTLEFPQGYPTDSTAEKLYENLDFMHGVEAFLYAMPGASVHAVGSGLKSDGGAYHTVLIIEH